MSEKKGNTVSVKILDKEFRVSCPEEEKAGLLASASLLNERMRKVRDTGNVIGAERIAIIAALNLTHELLKHQTDHDSLSSALGNRVKAIQERIESVLNQVQPREN